ncbi:Uncharacterised protein [Bordetella pertussis]|nr:Uncharacterised protein [Bordetella pertussis]CFP67189.1 Uncharacterised protein [Bordetella pertussis]CFV98228.1 Uncharacterised protein [Bordetella pertussis]
MRPALLLQAGMRRPGNISTSVNWRLGSRSR